MKPDIRIKPAAKAGRAHRIALLPGVPGDPFADLPPALGRSARALAAMRGFEAQLGQRLLLFHGDVQWLFAGLGPLQALERPGFTEAVGRALAELACNGGATLDLLLPAGLTWDVEAQARWATEALAMAGYAFDPYRSKPARERRLDVALVAPPQAATGSRRGGSAGRRGAQAAMQRGIDAGLHAGAGIHLARDLVNHPAVVADPDFVLTQARALAHEVGARLEIIRGEALRRQGYGAIYAVGAAATAPPALAALEYGRRRRGRPTVALVGKGVTFDSGGLDLKTSGGMALMKKDLGGAALVLGALRAIAGLRLPVHLVAVVGLAENAVGPRSYHPGDVLRSKAGPTIEVTNTDAEGRLVLADALALARRFKPTHLIDFATLTGACSIALGKDLLGLFCDDAALRGALQDAAAATGEALWPLPLWAPYRKKLESGVADLINATSDGFAGAITAALFLREFAGDVAWAHLDCYAWSDGDHPLFPKGGNGIGIRLLIDAVTSIVEGDLHVTG
ncbi:MAG: leucyl aminopeptidase family protein [Candidatus Lambdaproteobacteria bacterium]|nr:leucyl aminopeptidase family protein [Candidatus Lambdaproteobacteria bacterium]